MNATERVKERLHRAMGGLLREFEADGTQPVDCAFYVSLESGVPHVDFGVVTAQASDPTAEEKPKAPKKK